MADKILHLSSAGVPEEYAPITTSAGAGDSGKILALNGSGQIDITALPNGVGADTKVITASEALSAGDFVNIHVATGTKVRKADATAAGKQAHGFVLAAVSSSGSATVYLSGVNNQLSGLTVGANQFLGTTAGGRTETAPSTAGNVTQLIGYAISATEIEFVKGVPYLRA